MAATSQNSTEVPASIFMARFCRLPVARSTYDTARDLYDRIKSSCSFLDFCFRKTEEAGKLIIDSASPFAKKLQCPAQTIDELACKSLLKLEEKAPLISGPPDQIWPTVSSAAATWFVGVPLVLAFLVPTILLQCGMEIAKVAVDFAERRGLVFKQWFKKPLQTEEVLPAQVGQEAEVQKDCVKPSES